MLSIMLMTYAALPRLHTCRSSRHESSRTWLFLFSTCQWRHMIVMHALPAFHGQDLVIALGAPQPCLTSCWGAGIPDPCLARASFRGWDGSRASAPCSDGAPDASARGASSRSAVGGHAG